MVSILIKGLIWLIVIIFLFKLSLKIITGHDDFFDIVFNKISECYGYIRKCFRKKSDKVDADRKPVQDVGEPFDSSSVWED